jgi:lanosterol synthase
MDDNTSTFSLPQNGFKPFTDYSRWRLKADDGGRHIWTYLKTDEEVKAWPQTVLDKYWLGLETVR